MEGNSYEALKRPEAERRRWSVEEKLRVVRETLEPRAVTEVVAERAVDRQGRGGEA